MQRHEFSAASPGSLLDIQDGCAFIPNPLPPDLSASWSLHAANERAMAAIGELIGQARSVQNETLILRPLLTREAVESNKIEHTITRAADVLLHEAGQAPSDPERAKDNLEVLRYQHSVNLGVAELEDGRPVSLHLLRSLHIELLRFTRGQYRSPGEFRRENVLIGRDGDTYGSARFVPPPWVDVDNLMDQLMDFVAAAPAYSPLISAALMHYQLETIHPFLDGNGRLGRLMIPLYLLSRGVINRPLIYLSPYFERNRDDYIDSLKRVSTHGAWEPWLLFFLDAAESQARDALARVATVNRLQDQYREKARRGGTSKATLPAIDLVMERVIVSAQQVSDYVGCSNNTARSAISNLVDLGILSPVPRGHPARWWCTELLDLVYQS
jgi:Fic family protein